MPTMPLLFAVHAFQSALGALCSPAARSDIAAAGAGVEGKRDDPSAQTPTEHREPDADEQHGCSARYGVRLADVRPHLCRHAEVARNKAERDALDTKIRPARDQ